MFDAGPRREEPLFPAQTSDLQQARLSLARGKRPSDAHDAEGKVEVNSMRDPALGNATKQFLTVLNSSMHLVRQNNNTTKDIEINLAPGATKLMVGQN